MFEDLFSAKACCSCGLCCSKSELCERCLINTLVGNGLKVELVSHIRGLSFKAPNHGYGFQYSDLYNKICELGRVRENLQVGNYLN